MKNLTRKIMLLLIVALSVIVVVGCKKDEKPNQPSTGPGIDPEPSNSTYTYNTATSVFPTNWNPHTYQTATDNNILSYASSGFYEFDYNETKDGYQMVLGMATDFPIDVTGQYVGQYGVENGDEGKVYKIKLRDDLKWSTGEAITPADFVTSAKLLLDPVAANYRADSLYTGDMTIYNAKNYLFNGMHKYAEEFVSENYGSDEYIMIADLVEDENGIMRIPEGHPHAGQDIGLNLKSGGNWGSNSLSDYAGAGYFLVKGAEGEEPTTLPAYQRLVDAANDEGIVVLTKSLIKDLQDVIAHLQGFENVEAYSAAKAAAYPKTIIGLVGQFMEKYGAGWKEAWEKMPAETTTVEGEEVVGKDQFTDVVYKVVVTVGEGEAAHSELQEKTGVTTAEEYAAYKAYINAVANSFNATGDYPYVEWQEMAFIGKDYKAMEFTEVGVFVDADGDLCIALEKSLKGFYLLYSLGSSWLVNEKIYKGCASIKDGVYSNTYGTSVETFASYGPYTLTEFEKDKVYVLEKNKHWYGYNDEANKDFYQTTKWEVKFIKEASTRLESFIRGEIDVYGLSADDMEEYGASDHLYYSNGASTFFVAFNPNKAALEQTQAITAGTNKTILTIKDFRKALSLALDRAAFCLACDPTGSVATAVFNSLIISDPDNGTPYRNSEEAKDIILNFWGLADEVGEGKRYETKDDAIDAITGVDLAQARELFTSAYNEAKEAGLISDSDVVELKIGLPNGTTPFYAKGYDFLSNCWKEAVKGTPLEGRIRFTKDDTLGNSFADALRENKVDVLFGVGWQGSALNPYNLVNAYTLPSYQYDPAIDYKSVYKDVTFASVTDAAGTVHENVTLRASIDAWSNVALQGDEISAFVVVDGEETSEIVKINAGTQMPMENRCRILWACEAAILEQYTLLPLNNDSSAALKGRQIKYYTEEEIFGMGRGGIKYMSYNYDDQSWEEYVKSNGGKLNYK